MMALDCNLAELTLAYVPTLDKDTIQMAHLLMSSAGDSFNSNSNFFSLGSYLIPAPLHLHFLSKTLQLTLVL